ncbi:prepilin-type N-terminal cleavage/methylation domain-containing protein [Clostridium collagenovorans DSM 3089]|uniref:Prepilin-type N-terminal cleavage/methylation domain-containing protein n=1 Tax=Clostridium collagenovorans DSM 3089 TaxID=1121306 RepID=A0A1M5TLZ4_9CLOT|nr:type II secretion system protein [Clostridium collagenovorans]SHH51691.1 prepilin-type N-terminal cleavage/methylation domain-containing protein [Clostridium collagenovorans DSM 3089]
MKTKKKGFTLLEVIFAVAILGMVIVMIYPSMASSFDLFRRAKDIDAVNNFATNSLETFKKDPVEFWKKVGYTEVAQGAYDKNNVDVTQSKQEIYYYKYGYGDKADNKFLYFDNAFKPLSEAEKDKAIYKMKVWGTKKSFSKITSNLLPEKNAVISTLNLSEQYNYFEAYKLLNPGQYNKPYDLGIVRGKDAKWVESFLFQTDTVDSQSNMKEPSNTGIVPSDKTYKKLTDNYSKNNSGFDHQYYNTMRNEGYEWFMHRFFRASYLNNVVGFPKIQANNFDYKLDSKDEPINIIMNVNNINLNKQVQLDFRNKLDNPIELFMIYDAKSFNVSGGQSIIDLMMENIKLNVLDNDVNLTFLSNEATLKNEHELFLELYRIDKKTNKEKKYDTFKVKALV